MPAPNRSCRHGSATLVVFGLVLMAALPSASAQGAAAETEEIERARAQFSEGRRLEDAGQWSEALALFQRVAAVKTTPQVRFHIALCLEHVGLWTQALDEYARARREAKEQGVREVVRESDEHLESLQKRIPTVTVVTPGSAPGDELFLDGRPIPMGSPPLPIRVDPGPHTAELRRDHRVVLREVFVVKRGVARVELDATRATSAGPPPEPAAPKGDAAATAQVSAGWLAVGAGAVSATLSFVFLGFRQSKLDEVERLCPSLRCSADRREEVDPLVQDGEGFATGVNVTVMLASVLAGGGLALVLTAPEEEDEANVQGRLSPTVRIVPAGAGLVFEARY